MRARVFGGGGGVGRAACYATSDRAAVSRAMPEARQPVENANSGRTNGKKNVKNKIMNDANGVLNVSPKTRDG